MSLVGMASPAVAAGGTVYVDTAWASTTPGADPDGGGRAASFGTDSLFTIASVLAAAPTRIEVGPGVYVEQVVITNDVEIGGRGAGVYVVESANATLNDVTVSTIRNLPLNGAQTGVGILAGETNG